MPYSEYFITEAVCVRCRQVHDGGADNGPSTPKAKRRRAADEAAIRAGWVRHGNAGLLCPECMSTLVREQTGE